MGYFYNRKEKRFLIFYKIVWNTKIFSYFFYSDENVPELKYLENGEKLNWRLHPKVRAIMTPTKDLLKLTKTRTNYRKGIKTNFTRLFEITMFCIVVRNACFHLLHLLNQSGNSDANSNICLSLTARIWLSETSSVTMSFFYLL